jgi:hypothetical protein
VSIETDLGSVVQQGLGGVVHRGHSGRCLLMDARRTVPLCGAMVVSTTGLKGQYFNLYPEDGSFEDGANNFLSVCNSARGGFAS